MIASNVPGCREVVRDGITGLLVEPRDARALATAMLRLGDDPTLRARMGVAARNAPSRCIRSRMSSTIRS